MLNRYPLWKYIMVALVILIGAIYALPNIYGEDPALQVTGARGAPVDVATLDTVKAVLENSLDYQSIALENGSVLIRFADTDAQISARDLVGNDLKEKGFIVALNLAPATPEWLEAIGASPMKLGLDLRGGVHFLMEVDMDAAMEKLLSQQEDTFRTELREEKIRYRSIRVAKDESISVVLRDEADMNAAEKALRELHPDMLFVTDPARFEVSATFTEDRLIEIRNYAVDQNITILRNRVNELGVAEPLVQRQGANRIVVELPGVQDTARAKEILGATATLEFRAVDQNADLSAAASGRAPAGSEVKFTRDGMPVVLKKRVILSGASITDASSSFDEYSRPQVNISLDSDGGSKMAAFSKNNIGQLMATVFAEYKDSGKRDANGKIILSNMKK